jgi:hypothetical protein
MRIKGRRRIKRGWKRGEEEKRKRKKGHVLWAAECGGTCF